MLKKRSSTGKVLDSKSVKRKEKLIQKINHLEKEAGKLRSALKRLLGDREYGTAVTLITDTEDGLYACTYRTAKGVHCHSLTRIDRMGKDGCTVDRFYIPLVESVPTTHQKGLKGYCRLGGSETFVPQYLSLKRSHLRVARTKNIRIRKRK